MTVTTTGSISEIEHRLLAAAPGTRVRFSGAVEATVAVLGYGFETVGAGGVTREWCFGDQFGRRPAARRAAEYLTRHGN